MEKLSELSKPKAFVVTGGTLYQDRAFTDKSTAERSKADRHDGAVVEPLYSQEYVSALDKVAQFWIGESAGWKKRAEDAEKRIAELEDAEQKLCAANVTLDARASAAEAKLATPVQLPKPCAFNLCDLVDRDAVIASLREQGFTVSEE